jgi:DNA-binding beta-propeller fold protein YncE
LSEGSGGGPGGFAVGAGSLVAGYRLEQQIGQGGMAVVYRAHDSRLDRDVALKVLAPALAEDDSFRQRFIRESRAAAAVDDAHIIPVYEAGEERGVLFIAMRFVRGGDVRTLLDAHGPLSPERATEILSQAASALDAAHARGLVHRDVKPANMLLEASPDADRPDHVYLSDFGLAKGSLSVTGLTSTGQFLGTLDYVAPEQVEGRPVDGRTDQYALGCVAFELLTGLPPFQRDQGMAVMYAQVAEAPPLLSSRRAGVPPGVDDILNRALAKAPADRYPSCRQFAAELRRAFRLGAAGPPPPPAYRPPTQLAGPSHPSAGEAGRPEAARPGASAPGEAGRAAASFGPEATRAPAASGPEAARAAAGPGGPSAADYPDNWFRPPTGGASRPGTGSAPGPADPPTQGFQPAPQSHTTPGLTSPEDRYGGPGGRSGQTGPGPVPRRRWWRSPVPLALIAALAIVGGGGGYVLASHQSGGDPSATKPKSVPVGPIIPPPGCTSSTPTLKPLPDVNLHTVPIGGKPFAVVESADRKYIFATTGAGLAVLQNNGPGSTPTYIRVIDIKGAQKGMVLTPDGKYLLAAGGDDAIVISVQQAEQGAANPVTGVLDSPSGSGAAQVAASPDGKFVFLTLQNTTHMAVFNLARALSGGFNSGDFVGFVPLGVQPVGIGISPDGKWLYATSFEKAPGPMPAPGTLSVFSVPGAETSPATAVKAVVDAGCSPARVITDKSTVWVTARDSNALLAFSAARLLTDPKHALLAKVGVGMSPIGLTFADGGKRIVVADTNLNSKPPVNGDLAVVDTAQALAQKPALLGIVPANGEPRQVTVADNGASLLMANMVSGDVQALQLSDLP